MSPASSSVSIPPPSPLQKHVQLVSKAASEQLLFKFPDLPNQETESSDHGDHTKKNKKKRKLMVVKKPDVNLPSCLQAGSWKQLDMGVSLLAPTSPARPSSVSTRVDSMDARTPLLTPLITPRSRKMLSPILGRSKSSFKRHAHSPSMTDKIIKRFAKGAPKCFNSKYRMRIQLASRRYRLKSSIDQDLL